jgi:hypothetical protein
MALARDVSVCCHGTKGETMANAARKIVDFDAIHDFLTDLFGADVHARRGYSLAKGGMGSVLTFRLCEMLSMNIENARFPSKTSF